MSPPLNDDLPCGNGTLWQRLDEALFPTFAGACVLYAATTFYGSLHRQTHGEWSAPLDDVFIHFDYARATARGYPFQWSEGNGFSSGNTSLVYPFVLALGYWVGFHGMSLMLWAALVACISTFAFMFAGARLTAPLGRWAKYLVPPAVLAVGALDWSLFSGMENAFHLAVWGLALEATLWVVQGATVTANGVPVAARLIALRSWIAGMAGALLYATRPESVVCIAAFAVFAALAVRRSLGTLQAIATTLRIGLPGAITLLAQGLANQVFTGEWSANGAIAKLALNNPYMTRAEKWAEYLSLLKYVVYRNAEHHFAEGTWGWIVPIVALLPLFARRTRPFAILLWCSALGWLAVVSLNGQVRWQNERYTMSAVAWVLVLFAMGFGVLLRGGPLSSVTARSFKERALWAVRLVLAVGIAIRFWMVQLPQMRDQVWFFGRASRNILDQQIVAGRRLAELNARRTLVGDAGAIQYAADRTGLDIIGLGGYHNLPFARASVHGLGASLELIERMPPKDRPDTMAIYPSWWGDLPTLFGHRLEAIPVYGNVICGGAEKVLYKADWSALDRGGRPRVQQPGERIVDELDVADLVSEKEHRYVFPHPSMGFVDFRVLGDTLDPRRDLFDAGRVIPAHQTEVAHVHGPTGPGRLVVRTVVGHKTEIDVTVEGRSIGRLRVRPSSSWVEASINLPAGLPAETTISLTPLDNEWLDCHVWILDSAPQAER